MTEHAPRDPFEVRLAGLVRTYTTPAVHPVDPLATTRTAIAATARSGALGRLWPRTVDRRLVRMLAAAALVIALAAVAVVVGSLLTPDDDPGRLVFIRDGDLWVANGDGSDQTRIAHGGANQAKLGYLTAAWSPDGRHIAAARDTGGDFLTPAVDILTPEGAVIRTIPLEPGCGPSLTWSPDGSEVAIATCPADVPRDAIEGVDTGIGLLVAGLDASADRRIVLPAEWRSWASASRAEWTRPDLWAQWSPDGRWIKHWAIAGKQKGQYYLVATDGSGTRRIDELTDTLGDSKFDMDWSPDGRRLAIAGVIEGCPASFDQPQELVDEQVACLEVVGVDGGPVTSPVEPTNLEAANDGDPTTYPEQLSWPRFSPDGGRVAFHAWMKISDYEPLVPFAIPEPHSLETRLYVHDLASGKLQLLASGTESLPARDEVGTLLDVTVTGEPLTIGTAQWSPDGRRLLFLRGEAGELSTSWSIRSIDAAGGSPSSVLVEGVQSFDLQAR